MAGCEPWYIRIGRPLVFGVFRLGAWRLLGRYTGDVASMRLADRVLWAYKREEPLRGRRRPRRMLARTLPAGRTKLAAAATPEHEISLLFVGDIMPLTPFAETPSKVELGRGVGELFAADVLLANLEGPVGDREPQEPAATTGLFADAPRLVMTPGELEMHRGYLSGGTVVVSTANNHAWDLGTDGVHRTLDELKRVGAVPVGTGRTPDEAVHQNITVAGLTIGLVPFTFGTNGLGGGPGDGGLVNVAPLNEWGNAHGADQVVRAVRACRAAGCDLVVVSLHWGLEFEWFPSEHQIRLARNLVEAGADVVWGHHPHVIQPAELHQVGTSGRTGLIMYSTGNLVTPVLTAHSRLSLAVRATAGTAGLRAVELVPMVFSAGAAPGAYRLDVLGNADIPDAADIVRHLRVTVPHGALHAP
uniref:Capsule synthesis protein CapA domain-containing protein n=1 Tax=uncultured bacterium esnapd14 TaxID=1366594 RepID=S5UBD1_9BACT|nr:hypothetical protein [uncultured bacterium esnapd14]